MTFSMAESYTGICYIQSLYMRIFWTWLFQK